jgi:hypothetical protein
MISEEKLAILERFGDGDTRDLVRELKLARSLYEAAREVATALRHVNDDTECELQMEVAYLENCLRHIAAEHPRRESRAGWMANQALAHKLDPR